jgi:hypothetical protein
VAISNVRFGSSTKRDPWITIHYDERTWRFDAAFLTSNWECIYGNGCQGITEPQDAKRADGCCAVGAQLTDVDDFVTVNNAVSRLTPSGWQNSALAKRKGWFKRLPNGTVATRVINGGCIFLNRPGFSTGPGCAFHFAAEADESSHVDWKPNVCWQLPLRVDDTDGVDGVEGSTVTIRAWNAEDFGSDAANMHWWCTRENDAFVSQHQVVHSLATELTAMLGIELYQLLLQALDSK